MDRSRHCRPKASWIATLRLAAALTVVAVPAMAQTVTSRTSTAPIATTPSSAGSVTGLVPSTDLPIAGAASGGTPLRGSAGAPVSSAFAAPSSPITAGTGGGAVGNPSVNVPAWILCPPGDTELDAALVGGRLSCAP
jgi:hypothetical protein